MWDSHIPHHVYQHWASKLRHRLMFQVTMEEWCDWLQLRPLLVYPFSWGWGWLCPHDKMMVQGSDIYMFLGHFIQKHFIISILTVMSVGNRLQFYWLIFINQYAHTHTHIYIYIYIWYSHRNGFSYIHQHEQIVRNVFTAWMSANVKVHNCWHFTCGLSSLALSTFQVKDD